MSHNFKRPASISAKDRQDERDIKLMTMQVTDQAMLDKLLEGADPVMRAAMIERLRPYLCFEPDEVSNDCPYCGRRGGAVVAHQCLGVN